MVSFIYQYGQVKDSQNICKILFLDVFLRVFLKELICELVGWVKKSVFINRVQVGKEGSRENFFCVKKIDILLFEIVV